MWLRTQSKSNSLFCDHWNKRWQQLLVKICARNFYQQIIEEWHWRMWATETYNELSSAALGRSCLVRSHFLCHSHSGSSHHCRLLHSSNPRTDGFRHSGQLLILQRRYRSVWKLETIDHQAVQKKWKKGRLFVNDHNFKNDDTLSQNSCSYLPATRSLPSLSSKDSYLTSMLKIDIADVVLGV